MKMSICKKCGKPKCKCALALKPAEVFKQYCEDFPWAAECKVYEV